MYTAFMKELRELCAGPPDKHKGGDKQHYELLDGCVSAFARFFTQSSFLAYQREVRLYTGHGNAKSLFGVTEIPSDNQIRNLLDPIDPTNRVDLICRLHTPAVEWRDYLGVMPND